MLKHKSAIVCWLLLAAGIVATCAQTRYQADIDDVIADIYAYLSETEEIDFEELQNTLTDFATSPLNINTATADDLAQLRFLTDRQIDAILLYVYQHQMHSVSELRLIKELKSYDIRNLLPFVYALPQETNDNIYWREVFVKAKHQVLARTDARYIEDPHRDKQHDPVYAQLRYKFNYHNLVQASFTLRRPTGAPARDLQYGGYIQLKRLPLSRQQRADIPLLETLVLGNFDAQFGQGLVAAYTFHTGKNAYAANAATAPEGLRKYASTDGNALHGIGATLKWKKADLSAWYSITKPNDSLRQHVVGVNLTARLGQWKIGLTTSEKIYSDSLRYYYETARYNQHYFRGDKQWVGGLNMRCRYGIADLFAEAAAAQNKKRWGAGVIAGVKLTPVSDIALTILYRYYSPYFDNTQGYAFSETSRSNDENGVYVGLDVRSISRWRLNIYGDVFRFDGVKYGIPYRPSWGFDTFAEAMYMPFDKWNMSISARAREKAKKQTFSLRWRQTWEERGWHLRTQADGNMVRDNDSRLTFGVQAYQDVHYTFAQAPLTLQLRLQGFYIRRWDNRVYTYENDVLYGYSIPAVYGEGGRAYLNVRWKVLPQLALYCRLSETVYTRRWAEQQLLAARTRTDAHLLIVLQL